MRFGGHETFPIREGWLHKGLALVREDPEKLVDEYAADWLGVGRNMAKSIRHWLNACGLASVPSNAKRSGATPEITSLGELILDQDPYVCDAGTLWVLHTNLVRSADHAASWNWFFNYFGQDRFDRGACVDGINRYLKVHGSRLPSPRTLERDIGCLLASYARSIPYYEKNPEDGNVSPFSELGLMTLRRETRNYQLNRAVKEIPPEIFAYVLASGLEGADKGLGIGIHQATHAPNSPGRVFVLTSETLFELVQMHEEGTDYVKISGQAGERVVRIDIETPLEWLKRYYESQVEVGLNAT